MHGRGSMPSPSAGFAAAAAVPKPEFGVNDQMNLKVKSDDVGMKGQESEKESEWGKDS